VAIFYGDTIGAEAVVRGARESGDGKRGVVTMRVDADNRDDALVSPFDRIALLERRSTRIRSQRSKVAFIRTATSQGIERPIAMATPYSGRNSR